MSQPTSNLNPSATEFVPSFNLNANANSNLTKQPTYANNNNNNSYNHHQSSQQMSNNHNNNNNSYNQQNRYHNNSYHNNHHRNNYHNNNNNNNNNSYNNRSSHNHQHNHNSNYFIQDQSGFDPIEIEARCEAVVEILQDDKIREHLNPASRAPQNNDSNYNSSNSNYSNNNNNYNNNNNNNNYGEDNADGGCEDEEELLEMMAMQEECKLEMMKFYIQSQNPALFEEIYHDVSYPDGAKPTDKQEASTSSSSSANNNNTNSEKEETNTNGDSNTKEEEEETKSSESSENNTNTNTDSSIKDLLIDKLNPDAYEFVPAKFAELSLNDSENKANEK